MALVGEEIFILGVGFGMDGEHMDSLVGCCV